jgi:hypothetical protein
MVVVIYNLNVVPVKGTSLLKKKIVTAAKAKIAPKMFKVVRLNERQLGKVKSMPSVYASNATGPVVRFKYRHTYSIGPLNFTSCAVTAPTYSCQFAA